MNTAQPFFIKAFSSVLSAMSIMYLIVLFCSKILNLVICPGLSPRIPFVNESSCCKSLILERVSPIVEQFKAFLFKRII